MQLSPEAITDFKALYRTEYGVELSDAEAEAMARELLGLFRTIARVLPPEHARRCPLHRTPPSSQPPPCHAPAVRYAADL